MNSLDSLHLKRERLWRAPLLAERKKQPDSLDGAALALEDLGRKIAASASSVLGSRFQTSRGPVERRGYSDIPEIADRAWRISRDERETFCVVDELSQRMLLRFIVGGAPARHMTAIEKSIVAEFIGRLIAAAHGGGAQTSQCPKEELRARPSVQAWRCNVEICDDSESRSTLQLFSECAVPSPPAGRRPYLLDVPLRLQAGFFGITCALGDMTQWRPGTLLGLRRSQNEATALLLVGTRALASAQIGALYGERALRLLTVDAISLS